MSHAKEVEKQKNIEDNIAPADNVTDKGKKKYELDTLKRPLTKEEKEGYDKLSKEEQKIFIIKRWREENRSLEKKDMHEISGAEELLIGPGA